MSLHEGIAVSGTHGKSTTTAWLAFVLRRAGLDPSFVVGAECPQLGGGSGVGDGPHFVAEACEFDRSFLHLRPRFATVLNIEEDLLDYYRDLDDIRAAFGDFCGHLPADGLILLNGDDARCRGLPLSAAPVETFGFSPDVTWRAVDLHCENGGYSFDLLLDGRLAARPSLGLAGRHNVMNSLAVIALARRLGVDWDNLVESLREFRGARRRLELRGAFGGVQVADDYAHHPTEIQATLAAARERFHAQRIWCVFQPHQHSRTRFLLADFARSFRDAYEVVVPDIYFVRDSERERELVSSGDLVERIVAAGGRSVHVAGFADIVDYLLQRVTAGDLVLTMGAGDIFKVADDLVGRLSQHMPA
jgi:UDP-N-acetylmuramate--alanine ligase